jgi:hypothetical protein
MIYMIKRMPLIAIPPHNMTWAADRVVEHLGLNARVLHHPDVYIIGCAVNEP